MIKKIFLIQLIITLSLIGCTSDDNKPSLLIKSKSNRNNEIFHKYSYDNGDKLIEEFDKTYNLYTYYAYDSNDNMIKRTHNGSGVGAFNYDNEDILVEFNSWYRMIFSYNSNIVNVTVSYPYEPYNDRDEYEVSLELNNNNQVIKSIDHSYGGKTKTYEYDSNGNLLEIHTEGRSTYLVFYYDDKINPFFGQLNSIYFERFVSTFVIHNHSFHSYELLNTTFPYNKNNVIRMENNLGEEFYGCAHEYNENNMPKKTTHWHDETSGVYYLNY